MNVAITGNPSHHQRTRDILAVRPFAPWTWTADRDCHDVRLVHLNGDGRQTAEAKLIRNGRLTSSVRAGDVVTFTVRERR